MSCSAIPAKVLRNKKTVHAKMEETGKERCGFVVVNLGSGGPIWVGAFGSLEDISGDIKLS